MGGKDSGNPGQVSRHFNKSLKLASESCQIDLARSLIQMKADPSTMTNNVLPDQGKVDSEMTRLLIEHGLNPDRVILETVKSNNYKVLEALLSSKANPDLHLQGGPTTSPLYLAITGGHAECVKVLLDFKASDTVWEKEYRTNPDATIKEPLRVGNKVEAKYNRMWYKGTITDLRYRGRKEHRISWSDGSGSSSVLPRDIINLSSMQNCDMLRLATGLLTESKLDDKKRSDRMRVVQLLLNSGRYFG